MLIDVSGQVCVKLSGHKCREYVLLVNFDNKLLLTCGRFSIYTVSCFLFIWWGCGFWNVIFVHHV